MTWRSGAKPFAPRAQRLIDGYIGECPDNAEVIIDAYYLSKSLMEKKAEFRPFFLDFFIIRSSLTKPKYLIRLKIAGALGHFFLLRLSKEALCLDPSKSHLSEGGGI